MNLILGKVEIREYLNGRGIIMRICCGVLRSMTRIPNLMTTEREAFVSLNLLDFRLGPHSSPT